MAVTLHVSHQSCWRLRTRTVTGDGAERAVYQWNLCWTLYESEISVHQWDLCTLVKSLCITEMSAWCCTSRKSLLDSLRQGNLWASRKSLVATVHQENLCWTLYVVWSLYVKELFAWYCTLVKFVLDTVRQLNLLRILYVSEICA